jgi:hypothetical protein
MYANIHSRNDILRLSGGATMSTFNFAETATNMGHEVSETFGLIGGFVGACTGATLGFYITAPLVTSGALLVSVSFLGAGIFAGAFMGSALIWATGAALGHVISQLF